MNDFVKIISEICYKLDINLKVLSKGWVIKLEKDNKTRYISGYKFDLNSHGVGEIIDDKYAMFEVLKSSEIPVIKHEILFRPSNISDYAKGSNRYECVFDFFNTNNRNIVIKQNDGTCGAEVYHITDEQKIMPCLDKIFVENFSISICPYYDVKTEYRVIVLDNECVLIYGKKKPVVYGDGKSSIKELLIRFNTYYFSQKNLGQEYSKILSIDESYEFDWKYNLSRGAIPFKIKEENLKIKLSNIAITVAKKLNLKFGSVDIIETNDNELFVLEANSGVMMENIKNILEDGQEITKEIYSKAIIKMFEE